MLRFVVVIVLETGPGEQPRSGMDRVLVGHKHNVALRVFPRHVHDGTGDSLRDLLQRFR
jgi:hypothetical protein